MRKSMIFHLPDNIDTNYPSGSQIRPLAMIQAFKNIGYHVDAVIGYGKERKKKIDFIKDKIRIGEKYSFFYAENSTMPSILTEKNHFPRYPFMDFDFMEFCKESNIPIGLFYRDIYWNFKEFMKKLPIWKAWITILFQKYDLYKYKEIVDILYLPSKKMYQYIPIDFKGNIRELFPAANLIDDFQGDQARKCTTLELFYVGGIGSHYNLKKLVKTVSRLNKINLTICCRKREWDYVYDDYRSLLGSNIKIIHASGNELRKHYKQADIACLFVEPIEYWSFAMPVKLFEYLGHRIPIIVTQNTAAGEFIEHENIGWSLEYSEEKLFSLLNHILYNKYEINNKKESIDRILNLHTWEARALQVERELTI